MSRRFFTLADQIDFADLSGDNNPIHVDPIEARRSLFGQPIVHGIHTLMWALDQWLEGHRQPVRLKQLRVVFSKPIGLNQEIRSVVVSENNNRVRIDIHRNDEIAVRVTFEWLTHEPSGIEGVLQVLPEQQPPDLLDKEAIQFCRGRLNLYLQPETTRRLFPNLFKLFCPLQTAVLLGLTRLVGVKCPGLHSIFSELYLTADNTGELNKIEFSVSEFNNRFGLVLIEVAAPDLHGTIKALIRPSPQHQASFIDLKKMVSKEAFSNQRALIVGGSRGLGEVTAKLLAAGGAQVRLTYHKGSSDAQNIANEIIDGGGQASICELDILRPPNDWGSLASLSHLYYFATPFISPSKNTSFSSELFNSFCNYYVKGFAVIVEALQKSGLRSVFYPSTVFIDEMPVDFFEYGLAKNAGEVMCRMFEKKYPGIKFCFPRLPKMATDQTASFQPNQNPDPAPIILAVLQSFGGLTVSK